MLYSLIWDKSASHRIAESTERNGKRKIKTAKIFCNGMRKRPKKVVSARNCFPFKVDHKTYVDKLSRVLYVVCCVLCVLALLLVLLIVFIVDCLLLVDCFSQKSNILRNCCVLLVIILFTSISSFVFHSLLNCKKKLFANCILQIIKKCPNKAIKSTKNLGDIPEKIKKLSSRKNCMFFLQFFKK